mgnify:CR=1 FL=1
MHEPHSKTELTPEQLRRAWRIVTWAGFCGNSYYLFNVTGIPRIKYFTELHATAFDFGLMATFAAIAIAFQILGSMICNRVRRRKPFFMAAAITHRALYVGIIAAPLLFGDTGPRMIWILFVLFCHDMFAQISGPIWLSWMADIVPKEATNRQWAARQRTIMIATIGVMVALAFAFHRFETGNNVIYGYMGIAALGIVLGVLDIVMFLAVPEPPPERLEDPQWGRTLLQPLRDPEFRPFLFFAGYWYFAAYLAFPFFNLYMMEGLGMDVRTVQLLAAVSTLGMAVSARYFGLLFDRYGFRPSLQLLAALKILTPLGFILAVKGAWFTLPLCTVTMFLDGIFLSSMALGLQGPMLKNTPRRNRAMYIASANFFSIGVMACLAPALAGRFITAYNDSPALAQLGVNAYQLVFAASGALCLSAFFVAGRLHEPSAAPFSVLARQALTLTGLRVPHYVHVLQESTREPVRIAALKKLGALRSPMALGAVIEALGDPSLAVRHRAAETLGKIGAAEACEALAAALFSPVSGIQSPAARALGRIGGKPSLKVLLHDLRQRDPAVLGDIVDALAAIGDESATIPLIALFNDTTDTSLRQRIAETLARLNRLESGTDIAEWLLARTLPSPLSAVPASAAWQEDREPVPA